MREIDVIKVIKIDETFLALDTDQGIKQEVSSVFSYRPNGYKHSPKFKSKVWDGWIRVYSPFYNRLYVGLLPRLIEFAKERGYKIILPPELSKKSNEKVDDDYGTQLAKELESKYKPRDYQNEYVATAIRNERATFISPTASGKSFTMFLIASHYMLTVDAKVLIIVPTISLVDQMRDDFIDYNYPADDIHTIKGGSEKFSKKKLIISTWQSASKMPEGWMNQFQVVIGDEAHTFAAKSLKDLMESATNCRYRFALTGTLDGNNKSHEFVIEGLFGGLHKFVSTKELIDNGTLAEFEIKVLMLKYNKKDRTELNDIKTAEKDKKKRYHIEREFINGLNKRNIFIRNLLWSLKNTNNLLLFDLVEKHGKILEPMLAKEGRTLHFIHGGVSSDIRNAVRRICEESINNDILASTGAFSTGVNIKRIHNAISTFGGKSSIKILQSIGRTLRKGNGADKAVLYDIVDDLKYGGRDNYMLTHFQERLKIYEAEGFKVKIYTIDI